MKKMALHWQIIMGLFAGIVFGLICLQVESGPQWIVDWVKPFGTIFINLLKLIAIPLIIVSLIKGVSDLKDISQLSKMGLRTLSLFIFTTVVAVCIGLTVVNVIRPGDYMKTETKIDC